MISFNSLTKAQYDALSAITPDRIYFLTDTGELKLNGVDYGASELSSLVPSGGTVGQVLTKTETGSEWADAQGGGEVGNGDCLHFYMNPNASFTLVKVGNPPEVNLEYSSDRINWTQFLPNEEVINSSNNYLNYYIRGNNEAFSSSSADYYYFKFTSTPYVYGNVMSLLDKTCSLTEIPTNYCFNRLFCFHDEGSKIYVFEAKLPATKLTSNCYERFFAFQTNCNPTFEIKDSGTSDTYNEMFLNSSVSNIIYNSTYLDDSRWSPTKNWLEGVPSTGTFYCPYGLDTSIRNASRIPVGWNVVYTSVPEEVVNQAAAVENLIMNND